MWPLVNQLDLDAVVSQIPPSGPFLDLQSHLEKTTGSPSISPSAHESCTEMKASPPPAVAPEVRVLLIDDHAVLRTALRRLINDLSGLTVVGEAGSGPEGLRLARTQQPDLVIVDISLPGMNGFEVIRHLARERPELRLIVLTMHTDPLMAREAFRRGANSFLIKGVDLFEFERAIQSVMAGQRYMCSGMTLPTAERSPDIQ